MTKLRAALGQKAIAAALTTATLAQVTQPGVKVEARNVFFASQPQEEQKRVLEKGRELLLKLKQGKVSTTIDPNTYVHYRMRTAGLDTIHDDLNIDDLREHFGAGLPEKVYFDNWMWSNNYKKDRISEYHRMLDAWERVEKEATRIAIEHPNMSFESVFVRAVRQAMPEAMVPHPERWERYDFKNPPLGTVDQISDRYAKHMIAYPLFQPEAALRELRTVASEEIEKSTSVDDRGLSRLNYLHGLREQLKFNHDAHKRIAETAKDANIDPADLAWLVNSYHKRTEVMQTAGLTQQQREKEQLPFAMDVQRLTIGLFPFIRRMHEDGIHNVVIADRGARPIGKILEYISKEFDLGIDVRYAKFAWKEKLIEAYALTRESGITAQEREFIEETVRLRAEEKQHRQNPGTQQHAQELAGALEQRVKNAARLYERLAPKVEQRQQEAARKELAGLEGKPVLVIDDWMRTGKTTDNIIETLNALGIPATHDRVLMIVDTPENEAARSIYRDADALRDDFAVKASWREGVPWYKMKGCAGVMYGLDMRTQDSDKIFAKRRDLAGYALPRPQNQFYSHTEIAGIAKDVARSSLLDGSTGHARRQVYRSVIAALRDYGAKESYEGTRQRVNIARRDGFYTAIRDGVHLVAEKFRGELGQAVGTYLRGGALNIPEARVEAAVRNSIAEFQSLRAA